jgi:vacuolar-type H+-ATPase subunit F/Vma7
VKADADKPLSGGRLVVLGSAGLTEGFSLIGAEVHADADPDKVEEVLGQLVKDGS